MESHLSALIPSQQEHRPFHLIPPCAIAIIAVLTCRSMITKNFVKNTGACRELFFSEDLPQCELERYQAMLRENASPVPVIDASHPSLI